MCWGCDADPSWGLLEQDHGDPRSITTTTLKGAADAAGISIDDVVANINRAHEHFDPDYVGLQKAILEAETVDQFLLSLAGVDGTTKEVARGNLIKSVDEDRFLLMVAYSPNVMPLRGADKSIDVASPRVLELGCWRFMAKGAKTGMWHQDGHADEAICVENYIYRNDEPWVVKGEDGQLTGQVIKQGDWIVGFLLSEPAFALYKAGKIGGVSMQGGAARKRASAETLERIRSNA